MGDPYYGNSNKPAADEIRRISDYLQGALGHGGSTELVNDVLHGCRELNRLAKELEQ